MLPCFSSSKWMFWRWDIRVALKAPWFITIQVQVKQYRYRSEQAQMVDRGIAVPFRDLGARRGCGVSSTPWPLYRRERPGTHCAGGWVGPRAGLDVCDPWTVQPVTSLYTDWAIPALWFITHSNFIKWVIYFGHPEQHTGIGVSALLCRSTRYCPAGPLLLCWQERLLCTTITDAVMAFRELNCHAWCHRWILPQDVGLSRAQTMVYDRRRQPTARLPSVTRGTIFSGTLSELKYSQYDIMCLIYLIVLFFKRLNFPS
jgi:hypothetical protein